MKQLLLPANATFSASGKTITFASTIPASVSHILHVTNVTRGVLYFQPQAGSAYTGTYTGSVLTLACSTTGHADTDKLEIFYDDGTAATTSAQLATLTSHFPPALGTQTAGNSLSITPASGSLFPITGGATNVGITGGGGTTLDDVATAVNSIPTAVTQNGIYIGTTTDSAPASDTAQATLNGRLQRVAQNVTTMSAKIPTSLGIKTAANSLSIAPASDAAFPVTGTFFQGTQPISAASLPLPTGAATSAIQTTQQSSLTSIDSKTPALGQALAAASVPVVLTAAQLTTLTPLSTVAVTGALTDTQIRASALPVSAASLPLPTGSATAANQVSGGPQTGIGIATATTQRVTLASDGPEVTNSTAVKNSTATIAATASAANPTAPDTTLALLVRNLQEDNALTQMLLADIAQLLLKVFTQTSAGANPSLSVSQATAGNLNVTASITGTPPSNISQVGGVSVGANSYLPFSTNHVPVMVSQQVPLPVVPTYIYAGITV